MAYKKACFEANTFACTSGRMAYNDWQVNANDFMYHFSYTKPLSETQKKSEYNFFNLALKITRDSKNYISYAYKSDTSICSFCHY